MNFTLRIYGKFQTLHETLTNKRMTHSKLFLFIGKCLAMEGHPSLREEVVEAISRGSIPWESFVWMGSSQFVLPALCSSFLRNGIAPLLPEDLAEHMKEMLRLNTERSRRIIVQCRHINGLLAPAGIRPVFFKGAALLLTGLFRDPGDRMMEDIDLLLPEGDIPAALELLTAEGYLIHPVKEGAEGKYADHHHLPPMYHPGHIATLEIHRSPVHEKYRLVITAEDVLEAAKPCFPAEEIPEAAQPCFPAEEIPKAAQPCSLAEEVPEAAQPCFPAEEIPEAAKPWSLTEDVPETGQPCFPAEEVPGAVQPGNQAGEVAAQRREKEKRMPGNQKEMADQPLWVAAPHHARLMVFLHELHSGWGYLSSSGTLKGAFDFYLLSKLCGPEWAGLPEGRCQKKFLRYAWGVERIMGISPTGMKREGVRPAAGAGESGQGRDSGSYDSGSNDSGSNDSTGTTSVNSYHRWWKKELFLLDHPGIETFWYKFITTPISFTRLLVRSVWSQADRHLVAHKIRKKWKQLIVMGG